MSVLLIPLLLASACGSEPGDIGTGSGGQLASGGTGAASGGTGAASGGANSTGGNPASGGKATTGTSGGAANTTGGSLATGGATATGGRSATGGATATSGGSGGGAPPGLVDCDLRKVQCRSAEPVCPANQVPSVSGSCYGPCVPIESCSCSAAAECPHNETYTCWQRTHCGPYV